MGNTGKYIVQFDKVFLDGTLAGLTIPGQTITSPNLADASRLLGVYSKVSDTGDFMRDCGTGNRFLVSNVKLHLPK